MPYIKKDRQKNLSIRLGYTMKDPGELNYCIHQIIADYLEGKQKPNYQTYNDILGVLDAVGKEFYRRLVIPYEDEKIKVNGDVEPYASFEF